MLRHMRTTVRLDDAILKQAKQTAAARGETLTALIEKGLRLAMAQPIKKAARKKVRLPACRASGGTLPGIDLTNSVDMLDRMEGRQ